ncbi:MAG TPA: hypothetical protein DEP23_00120 [Ruminococcaceae bacterium]|nr:hypothetical protein [Oscillospiraceae bacterium]
MQGNNDLKNRYIMIPIPMDDVVESGIDFSGVIQTSAADGRIIIENVNEADDFFCDGDNPCDGDCENCPFFNPDCDEDEDCEGCPCCCPECGECMCDAIMIEGENDNE